MAGLCLICDDRRGRLCGAVRSGEPAILFVRGNADGEGETDISDAIFTLQFLFLGGRVPPCMDAGDANDSGEVDLSDSVYLLSFLFLGGPRPEDPYGDCGIDPSLDELTCGLFTGCP